MAHGGSGLFREEAVREQTRRLEGEVVFAQPLTARVMAPVFAAFIIAGCFFLSVAEYARKETVTGYLAPDGGMSTILPPRPGVVTQVFVAVGDRVSAGDLLLQVGSESTMANGAGLESALRDQLLAQRAELEASVESATRLFEDQQRQLKQRTRGIELQLEQLADQRRLAVERSSITEQRSERFAKLVQKGFASRNQYEDKREEVLAFQNQLRDLEIAQLKLIDQGSQLKAELRGLPAERDEKQSALRMRISEIDGQLREVESRSSYAIKAPVDGRLAALQVGAGSAVTPSLPVAVIMPEQASLEAALLVPTRAAGLIEAGQAVGIKFAAFPYEKFGIARGRITRIETAVLAPGELRTPLSVEEPVYRVVASLDAQSVRAFGRLYPLQAGMLLEADVVLEKRSFLEWILEPLYSVGEATTGA